MTAAPERPAAQLVDTAPSPKTAAGGGGRSTLPSNKPLAPSPDPDRPLILIAPSRRGRLAAVLARLLGGLGQ